MTTKKLTPLQAIKQYCKIQCCTGDKESWKECTFKECPLYSFRLGKNTNRRGIGGNPKLIKK